MSHLWKRTQTYNQGEHLHCNQNWKIEYKSNNIQGRSYLLKTYCTPALSLNPAKVKRDCLKWHKHISTNRREVTTLGIKEQAWLANSAPRKRNPKLATGISARTPGRCSSTTQTFLELHVPIRKEVILKVGQWRELVENVFSKYSEILMSFPDRLSLL